MHGTVWARKNSTARANNPVKVRIRDDQFEAANLRTGKNQHGPYKQNIPPRVVEVCV